MRGVPGGRSIAANAFLSVSVPSACLESSKGAPNSGPLCYVLSPPLSPSFLNLLNS
jgi:hypothetical protein